MGQATGKRAGVPDGDAPDLHDVTTRAELGARLTVLRLRCGSGLRELAAAVDSSPSTLSGWCRAENLPFPAQDDVFRALLQAFGIEHTDPWMDALARVREGSASATGGGPAPYRGLRSFAQADAGWFFGRTALLEQAYTALRALLRSREQPRVLMLVGASGSGKSSLLQAGLCEQLADAQVSCVSMTPGAEPVARLADLLADHLRVDPADARERLRTNPAGWLAADPSPLHRGGVDLAVVVDQFEELFTACTDPSERACFLTLIETIAAPGSRCAVVVGLRIDFYADVVATGHLVHSLQEAQILVGPMDAEQLTEAIVEPARQAGWSVDDDLVATLLRDFMPRGSLAGRHDAGALPLLSHALLETWSCARSGRLTVADYHTAGGIHGAVEQSAERVYRPLPPAEQALVRQIFLRLVHVGPDAVTTRRAASYTEIEGLAGDVEGRADFPSIADLLDRFVSARLITAQEATVEITHESLLHAWPRLRAWIDADRDALRLHRRLTEAAQIWTDGDRDESALVRGARLEELRSLAEADASTLRLSRAEQDFLTASVEREAAAAAVERRRTFRLRTLAVVALVFGLLAGSLAVVTDQARTEAVTARDEALSRQISLTAERLRGTDPSLAAQLAVAGYRVAPTSEARSAVLHSAAFPAATRYLGGSGPTALAVAPVSGLVAVSNAVDATVQLLVAADSGAARAGTIALEDGDAQVYALALTPDEPVLAVGDTSSAVTLWDVADPQDPQRIAGPLHGPTGPIQGIAVHPQGTEIAAVGLGEGVFRWDITDPAAPTELPLLAVPAITWSVAYSPDGALLAVGDDTGRAHLWELSDEPRATAELAVSDRDVASVAFSPDGGTLAAGSRAGELTVWDVSAPATPVRRDLADGVFDSWVNATAFSPDGTQLLAGSSDTDLRVWDTTTWAVTGVLAHPAAVTQVAFANDGDTVVSAAMDGTLRIWDQRARQPVTLGGSIWSYAFTADGSRMAAFSGADTGLWEMADATAPTPVMDPLVPDDGQSFTGAGTMSADGSLLAHGTATGEVLLFDVSDPTDPEMVGQPLGGSTELVEAVAFNADATLLAAGGGDTAVRIWDVANPGQPRLTAVLDDPDQIVLNVAWHPSKPLLAAPSADSHVYLYDLADPDAPRQLARLDGFDSEAYGAAFHPDRDVLATAGSDTTVLFWDITDPGRPQRLGDALTGPTGRVFDLDFAPTGSALAAAVADGTTWLWDTTEAAQPVRTAVLGPADGQTYTVKFSPRGDLLLSGGADSRVHLWPTDAEALAARICATAGDGVTAEEWATYVPGRAYDPPCAAAR